jgi:hypothetical protein
MTLFEEQLIRALRAEVRVRDGRPDDGRCGHVADAICARLGWKKQWGHLLLLDGSVCWVHCWNRRPDGVLVDATADQFEERWPGDILALVPDDPRAAHYLHAPPAWTFRTAGALGGGGVALFARREGDEHEELLARAESATGADTWYMLARAALAAMVPWAIDPRWWATPARVLRARHASGQETTSQELQGVLALETYLPPRSSVVGPGSRPNSRRRSARTMEPADRRSPVQRTCARTAGLWSEPPHELHGEIAVTGRVSR